MGTGQRKPGLRVIEFGIRPLDGVMTLFAGGRESGVRDRTLRIVEIVLVARNASRVRDVVVVVDMAVGARSWRNRMGTGQRETGLRVIEFRIRPLDGVVALLAGGGEAGVGHRTFRTVKILLVARNARSVCYLVVVDAVAVRACPRRNRVGSRQGESRFRVVETCRLPRRSRMA